MIELLRPFVVIGANTGKDITELEPDVRDVFTRSELRNDPNRANVFMFVLSHEGRVVHEFLGLPGRGTGRSDYRAELTKAIEKLELRPDELSLREPRPCQSLPDLKASALGVPAGVRMFIRQDDAANSHSSKLPVVEVIAMQPSEWQDIALSDVPKEIDATTFKTWLVRLYPAGIRTADESKRFQRFIGQVKLEPAGSDDNVRYAILRGNIRLAKERETDSTFEGVLHAVVAYPLDSPRVLSVRGVVEGTYVYRVRDTSPQQLRVAIESRPE